MLLSKDNFQCNSLLVLALLTYLFIAVYVRELHLVIVRAVISSLVAFYSLKPGCRLCGSLGSFFSCLAFSSSLRSSVSLSLLHSGAWFCHLVFSIPLAPLWLTTSQGALIQVSLDHRTHLLGPVFPVIIFRLR